VFGLDGATQDSEPCSLNLEYIFFPRKQVVQKQRLNQSQPLWITANGHQTAGQTMALTGKQESNVKDGDL